MLEGARERLRMDNEPKESIDPRALKVWMIGGAIGSAVLLGIAIGLYAFVTAVYGAPAWVGWAIIALALAYAPWGIFLGPWLRMRFWRYEVRENEIEIQHGIFVIKRHLIPMVRVQYVDTEHGPLMRYFGLTTLSISTAATRFAVPALPKQRAGELRGEIATLARVSEEDV
ncbi:MAG: PH domain-containing protein [Euryarchaeota archaeon]|nr:PH domain-containing protein [Euryarchaeota archaeon]